MVELGTCERGRGRKGGTSNSDSNLMVRGKRVEGNEGAKNKVHGISGSAGLKRVVDYSSIPWCVANMGKVRRIDLLY